MNATRDWPLACWLPGAAALLLVAALLRWWAAPAFESLPADYVAETSYTAQLQSRQTPTSAAEVFDTIAHRRDQALISGERHSIVQGDARWLTSAGAVIFETASVYGVDRRNRRNLTAYGSEDRTGQYQFPPHTGKEKYGLWDPIYAGPYVATFDRVEEFHGLEVYVFNSLFG